MAVSSAINGNCSSDGNESAFDVAVTGLEGSAMIVLIDESYTLISPLPIMRV